MKIKFLSLLLAFCLLITLAAACTGTETSSPVTTTPVNTTLTSTMPVNTTPVSKTPVNTTPEPATFIFTDSSGRKVEVPTNITRIALSGPLTQIVLFALCPDKLVGLATTWDAAAEEFLPKEYYNLPILGQIYGGKGSLNLEEIAATGAQIIIDIGETRDNMAEDMDKLQEQINIPTVHIDAYTASMGDAYRKLGELLNMESEAEVLAQYCDRVYANTLNIMDRVGEDGKARLLYCLGDSGINVIARGAYHAEIIDLLANNLAVVNNPSSKGTGNEVDLEQIMLWNPDVILFAPASIYSTVGTNADWADITAIKNGNYYEVPYGPYNWMGFPASVQRYLGMIWLAQLLYPEIAQYNVYQEVTEYYHLFYHYDLTPEQYNRLVANSLGKK
jgi:iron complex transport system substrate-binding protein